MTVKVVMCQVVVAFGCFWVGGPLFFRTMFKECEVFVIKVFILEDI